MAKEEDEIMSPPVGVKKINGGKWEKLGYEFLQKLSDDLLNICDLSSQLYIAQLANVNNADKPDGNEVAYFFLIKEMAKNMIKTFAQELPQMVQQEFDAKMKDAEKLSAMSCNKT